MHQKLLFAFWIALAVAAYFVLTAPIILAITCIGVGYTARALENGTK